jgi:hypothetical protein
MPRGPMLSTGEASFVGIMNQKRDVGDQESADKEQAAGTGAYRAHTEWRGRGGRGVVSVPSSRCSLHVGHLKAGRTTVQRLGEAPQSCEASYFRPFRPGAVLSAVATVVIRQSLRPSGVAVECVTTMRNRPDDPARLRRLCNRVTRRRSGSDRCQKHANASQEDKAACEFE